jgi:hypothetical protein
VNVNGMRKEGLRLRHEEDGQEGYKEEDCKEEITGLHPVRRI